MHIVNNVQMNGIFSSFNDYNATTNIIINNNNDDNNDNGNNEGLRRVENVRCVERILVMMIHFS